MVQRKVIFEMSKISNTAKIYTQKIGLNCIIKDYVVVYELCEIKDNTKVGESAVIGRNLSPTSAMVRNTALKKNITIIGERCSISSGVIIYTDVQVGCDSLIGDNSSILNDVLIGNKVLISRCVTINSSVRIGNNTRIMDNTHITGRSSIGNNVFISCGVLSVNDNLFGKYGFNENVKGFIIEDFVSIGPGCILMPGIRIGKGAIISAGSIVKKDIPSGYIAGGNPARIICKVPDDLSRESG